MARKGDIRGDHAHKKCTQLLVCVSGQIRVICDTGLAKTEYILKDMENGLLIPPCIWATQEYATDDAVLMVLCDRGYEAEDYIRDPGEFKEFLASVT
jgi:dTDP-4-dehydrorhamnose 3,5-epimerase-like enzyme